MYMMGCIDDAVVLLLLVSDEYVSIYYTRIHNPLGIVYTYVCNAATIVKRFTCYGTHASNGYRYGYSKMQRIKLEGEITHFTVKYSDRKDNNFTIKTDDCDPWGMIDPKKMYLVCKFPHS